MGMLIDGQWSDEDRRVTNAEGEFVRVDSTFRSAIEAGDDQYLAEPDRYHLFVNAGCPWAYRTLLYRTIKNLESVVSVSFTQPARGPQGWTFGKPEPMLGATHIHDVYTAADPHFTGRTTVPVLWDKKTNTIVNNESAEIIRMLDSAFDDLPGVNPARYYPKELATEIDAWNKKIYVNVNNGVYRCGFAGSQQAYEQSFDNLFAQLDQIEAHLADHRYLCGENITEADWRLFATLVRFDAAYYGLFRCNRNLLQDYECLWAYTRDLYQQPKVKETVDMEAIKGIYWGSRSPGIIPKGPSIDFDEPHHRG
ncbi:MAG: glutathione S-transferase C-terminal domain-containing protein [Pseudomonadota bacterium]